MNLKYMYIGKGLATIAVCVLGGYCMYLTNGAIGVGWSIFGVFIIWSL